MNFSFYCPHCNQKLEADEEWDGLQTNCPRCGTTITIEKPSVPENRNLAKSNYWSKVMGKEIQTERNDNTSESNNDNRNSEPNYLSKVMGNQIQTGRNDNTPEPSVPENHNLAKSNYWSKVTGDQIQTERNDNTPEPNKEGDKLLLAVEIPPACGSVLAGVLIAAGSRLAFWILAPIATLFLLVGIFVKVESKKEEAAFYRFANIGLLCFFVCWGVWIHTRQSSNLSNTTNYAGNSPQQTAETINADTEMGTLEFITNLSNGYGRITPDMSIGFVLGDENPQLNELVHALQNNIREYHILDRKSNIGLNPRNDAENASKAMKKLSDIRSLQNKYWNRLEDEGKLLEYHGNKYGFGLSGNEMGKSVYVYATAKWRGESLFWAQKITIHSGNNRIIFENDDTAF